MKFLPLFSVTCFSRSCSFLGSLLSVKASSYQKWLKNLFTMTAMFFFSIQILQPNWAFCKTIKNSFEYFIHSLLLIHIFMTWAIFFWEAIFPFFFCSRESMGQGIPNWSEIWLKQKLLSSDSKLWQPDVHNE